MTTLDDKSEAQFSDLFSTVFRLIPSLSIPSISPTVIFDLSAENVIFTFRIVCCNYVNIPLVCKLFADVLFLCGLKIN